jgi:hypothetical protein
VTFFENTSQRMKTGKGRGEAGEVTEVVSVAPTKDNLGKRFGAFVGCR